MVRAGKESFEEWKINKMKPRMIMSNANRPSVKSQKIDAKADSSNMSGKFMVANQLVVIYFCTFAQIGADGTDDFLVRQI